MYTPNNVSVYLNAFAGFMGGITAASVTETTPMNFVQYAQMADAYAQEVDGIWGASTPTFLELDEILAVSEAVWNNRSPLADDATTPGAYTQIAESVVARVRQGNAQVVSEGIDPNGGGSGPVAPGTVAEIRYVIGTAAVQLSAARPANGARGSVAQLEIMTSYDPGTTIEIGQAGSPAILLGIADNVPTAAPPVTFSKEQDTALANLPIQVAIGGAPANGAAVVVVRWAVPSP